MDIKRIEKYAALLVSYCLELREGDTLLLRSTLLAEPLVREVYRLALRAGAHVETDLAFAGKEEIFFEEAGPAQLDHVSPFSRMAMADFSAYLNIRAPFLPEQIAQPDPARVARHQQANTEVNQLYSKRIADKSLKRNLCQFPTQAGAQLAGMSLEDYTGFISDACRLDEADPAAAWLEVRAQQQRIVDRLHRSTNIRYVNERTDIRFRTDGRTWINSDGRNNMPSGEVFTAPVEESVNGVIHFDFPSLYQGHAVEHVTLWVEEGQIVRWEAEQGLDFLDHLFHHVPGTRYFGEAAIGTNYRIRQVTNNILFDEKIGGSVHMAIGQSYLQCGGKNQSSVHWDLIADMREGGMIFADDEKIYENGKFLLEV